MLYEQHNRLIFHYDSEEIAIESWGTNALRVRGTKHSQIPRDNWALQIEPPVIEPVIAVGDKEASITNGKIKAVITSRGKITIYNSEGKTLLEEYARSRQDPLDPKCSALEVEAREFRPIPGGDYRLTIRFESLDKDEKIYGMGQYQQPYLDLKGLDLELAHRNSQASIPFAVSSLGYGFLWNNPAVGRAVFGKNTTSFEAYSTRLLDYWVTAGDSPKEIVEAYAAATGTVPMMPEYGLGFWQRKLRYQTQEELLEVAREYKRRKLPIDLIVVDFFHWRLQGEWKFDPTYWPDPTGAMICELKEMNIELMISIWPTVDKRSENYNEMRENGYLIRTDRGIRTAMDFQGDTVHFDATHPHVRFYVWQKVKENYYSKGVRSGDRNIYPFEYSRAFYEGMRLAGQTNIVNLVRCAWAGSQRFGALVWSGDIASSWESLRCQITAGLNMGLSGIPWWTTDIGGFHGGNPKDEAFRELFIRWFQWGAFCPVMRLHGDREPRQSQHGTTGGATCRSGAPNEVWSYGDEVYKICVKYLNIRERLRDYIRGLMEDAHEKGTPVMRPCFYDFPEDKKCWEVEDQYMFGQKYLCAPVLYPGRRMRSVYLPPGPDWHIFQGEMTYKGGSTVEVDCPIDSMPVFERKEQRSGKRLFSEPNGKE